MDYGMLRRLALAIFCMTLALAPLIGGVPSGSPYGSDTSLNALRCLTLVSALLLTLIPTPNAQAAPSRSFLSRAASALMLCAVGLTVLSLLVHSGFLTRPVLLFALVPGTLDWIVYGTVFLLTLYLAREPQARQAVLTSLLVGATLAAVWSVWEGLTPTMPGQRAQGAFFSPNFAAGLFALCLPVVAAWCLALKDKRGAIGLGISSALMAGALFASGSRAGIALAVAGLITALALALIMGQASGLPWRRIAVLSIGILACGFLLRGAISHRANAGAQEQSGDFRKWTWRGTVNMARANPLLGTGPGTYPYVYPRYARVEKTDLAHSSYLQIASEQGVPVLVATVGAIAAAFLAGVVPVWNRKPNQADGRAILVCGLAGGLLAGVGRSVFDSEWSLLGNGIPFWSVAGLLVGASTSLASPLTPQAVQTGKKVGIGPRRLVAAIGLGASLVPAFLWLRTTQLRDLVQIAARDRSTPLAPSDNFGWPPDPDLALLGGHPDTAAALEPSGKRLYQLARRQFESGDPDTGIATMQKAIEADPNNLQSRNRFARMLAQRGKTGDSIRAYRDLISVHEGPAGQVRAIPELTETYPAFAYFAVGQAEDAENNGKAALEQYEKAAKIIEDYSITTPPYQQIEIESAARTGVNLAERVRELVDLYTRITEARIKREPAQKPQLDARRAGIVRILEDRAVRAETASRTP